MLLLEVTFGPRLTKNVKQQCEPNTLKFKIQETGNAPGRDRSGALGTPGGDRSGSLGTPGRDRTKCPANSRERSLARAANSREGLLRTGLKKTPMTGNSCNVFFTNEAEKNDGELLSTSFCTELHCAFFDV